MRAMTIRRFPLARIGGCASGLAARRATVAKAALAYAMTGLAVLMLSACGQQTPQREPLTGGDPARGQALIVHAGCGSCHTIEGVEGANSLVGPPLMGLRQRTYIGGVAANSATNLERWLMHPQAFSPRTAMPDLGLTEDQARDIAAYLYLH
jgi:cytochrome c